MFPASPLQGPAKAGEACSFPGAGCLPRPAAPASAETVLLSVAGGAKEDDLAAARAPRWARRPAVHARRADGVNERAVHARIARLNSAPETRSPCRHRHVP